nr:hypothetical protein [Morchella crassipes]
MQEGGAAPPLSLRSSWVAAVLGGPHENPWRPPMGPPRGLGGGLHPLTKSREGSWGGRCSRRPPPPPLASPPFQKMGRGDERGGMEGRGEGADSVLVCLRQTRDASPPTEGTVKAVRQPPPPPPAWFFCKGRGGQPAALAARRPPRFLR